jgi:hypothetical protein
MLQADVARRALVRCVQELMIECLQRAGELQRQLDEASGQLATLSEARSMAHEQAVLERQKLQREAKDGMDRQQRVIDR